MDGQLSGGGVSAPKKGGFEVAETWFDKVVVVSVSGVLDLLTAPHLGEAIDAAASKTAAGVIVDLSKVEFLASAEMAALATAHREITQFARFGVVADGPATSRPLKLIGIDTVVALYPTLADGLQLFTNA